MLPNQPKNIASLLTDAVNQAIGHYENGASMTDAIYKVASDLRLNPDQITRTCHLLNRANMNEVRLGDDVLKNKLANVEVVDPKEVIARCYGSKESESKTASAPSFPIANSLLKTASASTASVKHAAASPSRSPSAQPHATKIAGLYHGLNAEQVVALETGFRHKLAGIEADCTAAAQKLRWACKHAEGLLRRMPTDDMAMVANQARYHFEESNPDGLPALHSVMDNAMPIDAQVKLAIKPAAPVNWHKQASAFIAAIDQLDKLARNFSVESKKAAAEWGDTKARLEHLHSVTVDGETFNEKIVIGQSALEFDEVQIKQAADKHAAGMVGGFMGSMLGGGAAAGPRVVGPGVGPTDVDKFTLQIRQPQHEAALASIRARANLQDLVNNDPVIASYDPSTVIGAFNDLSQYSPRATESNAVLRSAMRQMLQNHASIFDLQQVRNTERNSVLR